MPKSQSDRTKMFNLLAGGLDDPEPLPAPEPIPTSSPDTKVAPDPTEETSAPTPNQQPTVGNDASNQVNESTSKQVNESTDKRKRRAKTGKRSDDAYMQTGMFLPVALVQEVKGYLAFDGNRQTINDLTEGLLQVWAAEKKAELAKRLTE